MFSKIKTFFELIKFEHTLFALPFAYLGLLLAREAWPSWGIFVWVTLAMAAGRTAGMCLNRLIDLKIDEKNPRTKARPLVTGDFKIPHAWIAVLGALVLFFIAAWRLNPLCFKLSPIALALLFSYHYVKRFSFLCHFTLGLVLAMAPIGGWLAVTGAWSWTALMLGFAVMLWVAGFDILYSLQDVDFDRTHGLHSVPVTFGVGNALKISFFCHLATLLFLLAFGVVAGLGILYWVGLSAVAALLKIEHTLVGDGELSHINTAFFTINGWVGILMFVFTFLEIY